MAATTLHVPERRVAGVVNDAPYEVGLVVMVEYGLSLANGQTAELTPAVKCLKDVLSIALDLGALQLVQLASSCRLVDERAVS